jgi:hypothetical protein
MGVYFGASSSGKFGNRRPKMPSTLEVYCGDTQTILTTPTTMFHGLVEPRTSITTVTSVLKISYTKHYVADYVAQLVIQFPYGYNAW